MLLSTHRKGHAHHADNAKRFLIHVDVWIIDYIYYYPTLAHQQLLVILPMWRVVGAEVKVHEGENPHLLVLEV